MFLYRNEIYNPDSPDRGTAEVILDQHRDGPTGKAQLAFLFVAALTGALRPGWTRHADPRTESLAACYELLLGFEAARRKTLTSG